MAEGYRGIDYGRGTTNLDRATGIRYGVIHQNDVGGAWFEAQEADYGEATCPKCGNKATAADGELPEDYEPFSEHGSCDDYRCSACHVYLSSESAFPDEALGYFFTDDEYAIHSDADDGDIWITKSPYYTRAQFCSPCAPGACYLTHPIDNGERAYCLGPEWFEDDKAPYPVYRMSDDSQV